LTVSFEFSPEDRLCIWTMSCRLTAETIIEIILAARDDPRWSNDYDFLTIMTDANLAELSVDATSNHIHRLAELDTPRSDGRRKRAAVVCSDELAAGLLVYYEARSKSERATDERYFKAEAHARAWLAGDASIGEHEQSSLSA
tara:strand:- start:14419 stop:14847 length:429 start_codon:yes stop_codon:yes gene_type:complete